MKRVDETIMRTLRKYILLSLPLWGGPGWGILTSCVDNPMPTSYLLPEQLESMADEVAQERLLSGIVAFVNDFQTWSSSDQYYTQDWGYPCQMFYREVLGSDMPVYGGAYNYWVNVECNTSLTGASYYTYYYYYSFIRNCNNLIALIPDNPTTEASRHNLGCALAFRAMCYLDMARMFEFMPTGYTSLDGEATANGIWGLTVPLVSDKTPDEQLTNNPRVSFTTMYRFILHDLNQAEQMLSGYERTCGNYPDLSVVYGLQARLWLEMGERFDDSWGNEERKAQAASDLKAQLAKEGCGDGYADLGITSSDDCFARAADYARRARSGYTPMTEKAWCDPTTGFNTANDAWMLFSRVSTQEQEANYYSALLGVICSEATWGMAQYSGGNYRCIGDGLYKSMPDGDWRKKSWLDPADVTVAQEAIKIKDKNLRKERFEPLKDKYGYQVSDTIFSRFPDYANLKFRTRDVSDMTEGLKCDIPLMRVEEMFFIEAEAEAHFNGVAAGAALLQAFVNTYRYTDGSYTCTVGDLDTFHEQMMQQKRIEFWGEGICYFDYKRLRLPVRRSESTNYPENMRSYTANNTKSPMDSKPGYVCPSMNYYILNYEINNNPAVIGNPDCTKWYEKQ